MENINSEAFHSFLIKKKIDPIKFLTEDSILYSKMLVFFNETGPVSFDQQKKFLLNPWRLKFPLNGTN
jgi:hypothetical protein